MKREYNYLLLLVLVFLAGLMVGSRVTGAAADGGHTGQIADLPLRFNTETPTSWPTLTPMPTIPTQSPCWLYSTKTPPPPPPTDTLTPEPSSTPTAEPLRDTPTPGPYPPPDEISGQ